MLPAPTQGWSRSGAGQENYPGGAVNVEEISGKNQATRGDKQLMQTFNSFFLFLRCKTGGYSQVELCECVVHVYCYAD